MRLCRSLAIASLMAALIVGFSSIPSGAEVEKTIATLTDCIEEHHQLSVLFLLDESRSLRTNDPDDVRVRGVVESLSRLEELQRTLSARAENTGEQGLNINVRIDGFGGQYLSGTNGEWEALSSASLPSLENAARQFTNRDAKKFTNYIVAMEGANSAFEEQGGSTCKMLLWFTDGEYDSDNGQPLGITPAEEEEIRSGLCGQGGAVEDLRDQGVAILAFALSTGNRPPDTSLVEVIAEGGNKGSYSCGEPGRIGIFNVAGAADELITGFAALLTDTIFEAQESPSGQKPLGCQGETEQCVIDFQLGPWTETFDLYLEVPPNPEFEILVKQPDGTEVKVENLNATSGILFSSPSTSWRLLSGSVDEIVSWSGWWELILRGPGSEKATATIKFAFDELAITPDESLRITRSETESYAAVPLVLTVGQTPLTAESLSGDEGIRLTVEVELPGGREVKPERFTSSLEGDTQVLIPESILKGAFEGDEGFLPSLELLVTPEVAYGRDSDDRLLYHPYDSSSVRYWLYDEVLVELSEPNLELDRTDPDTLEGREVEVTVNGEPLVLAEGILTLKFVVTSPGGEEILSREVELVQGEAVVIPSEFLDEVINEEGLGADLLLLKVKVMPTLKITKNGVDFFHPGLEPSVIQLGVRTGPGYPTILGATIADIDGKQTSTLTIETRGPDEGAGTLNILGLTNLPEGLEGELVLKTPTSCRISEGELQICEAEVSTDFDANMTVELSVLLALDGERAEKGLVEYTVDVKPFSMTRPLDKGIFATSVLKYLAIFLIIQLLLAAITAALLSRWMPMPPLSRSINMSVRVSPEGSITAQGGGPVSIAADKTQFVSQLEESGSHADISGAAFSINWLETFIGKSGLGLLGIQKEMIVTSVPGAHCFGPEGQRIVKASGIGLVGTSLRKSWALWFAEGDLLHLAEGESVDATLLLVLVDFSSEPFEDQLEKVSDKIDTVVSREIPLLIHGVLKAPEQEIEEIGKEEDTSDPGDFGSDSFSQKPVDTKANGDEAEGWPSDPDDLLA